MPKNSTLGQIGWTAVRQFDKADQTLRRRCYSGSGFALRIPVEAAVEVGVIVFADGNGEIDVAATRSSILVDARGEDRALRPIVLSHQAAQIAEPVSAQKE